MANSIVRLNGTTLITVDDTTTTAGDVSTGHYFYNALGVKTLGTSKSNNPPYLFPDTTATGKEYVVSNGNHVHFNNYVGQASVLGLSIGTYQISAGSGVWTNTVDNRPTLFTLHAGDKVELSATLTYNSGSTATSWVIGLREANAASSVIHSEGGSGAGKKTVSAIITEDVDVSTVYMELGASGMGMSFEADFELYVSSPYLEDNPATAPVLVNNWDFTTSLTDTVGGLAATLGNGTVQDSNGVTIAAANQFISIPLSAALGYGYEIDFGTMTQDFSSQKGNLFMTSPANLSEGLALNSTGSWKGYYASTWDTITPGTDATVLSGKTLRAIPIECTGYNGSTWYHAVNWRFYVNGNPWYYPLINTGTTSLLPGSMTIGSGAYSFYTMVVTGFRIYSNVDGWL